MMLWLQLATGFTGALTLVVGVRALLRWLGFIPSATAYFAPKGGGLEVLVKAVKGARREVLIQARCLSAEPLSAAVVEAKKRGVHVEIVLDPVNEKERAADARRFLDQEITPLVDAEHPAAHGQVVIIDRKTLLTGSLPFSDEAETAHAGDLLVLKGHGELVESYRQNFLMHKGHARAAQLKPAGETSGAKKAA